MIIVVINFPFSNLAGSKRRPALVVADLDGDDIILCQITTCLNSDRYAIQINEDDFDEGKLSAKSLVRPNKLFAADKNLILYTACKVKEEKMKSIIMDLINIINGRERH